MVDGVHVERDCLGIQIVGNIKAVAQRCECVW